MKLFRMKNIGTKLFFIVVFILCIAKSNAQDNSGCLTKHQLIKMQSASLDDIRMFLNNGGWSFDGAKSNQSYNYFDYPISYDVVLWKNSSYYNGGNILLYTSASKPKIVVYQLNSSCFNDLLQSFNAIVNGKTNIDSSKLVTTFKEANITIEFREYKNDYSSMQFSILVYNSTALFQEIQILKKQAEALKKAEAEKKKKYDNALEDGDVLFSSSKFEMAKLKYLTAFEIENNVLVQSKIDLCDKAICEKIISKGDSLYNVNQYDKALSVFTEAKGCSKSLLSLQSKIDLCDKAICEKIISKGDSLYNVNQYDKALSLFTEAKGCSKSLLSLQSKIDLCDKAICEKIISKGDSLYSVNQYDKALSVFTEAKGCSKSLLSLQSKIDLCDKAICEKIISKGDSLYSVNQYDKALSVFTEAKGCSKSLLSLQEKIKITERKILDDKINTIQSKADLYFNDKKYDIALENYNSILLLDKSIVYASERVKQILEIKNVLAKRITTVFSYKNTNRNDLIQFQNLLLNDMKLQINKYKEGFLNLNYLISYDTIGTNLSSVKNISTSLTGYSTYLSKISQNGILKPASESGYFLASKENLTFDVKWSTTKNLFKSNSKGIFQNEYPNSNLNAVESFINKQSFKYGKYLFEVKNKVVNGNSYSDINLVKYRTVGPEAAFFSMLMPGMGTLKVTYGEKGRGRFTCFLLSSGLAIGSKLYSDAQYKSYLGATNQADIDKYYNNANTSHKIAIMSGSISASIYLYDIIWVISKGAKNIKDSKPLRKQLQQGPVQIQNQSISWQ